MHDVLCLYPGPASFRQRQVAAHRPLLDALGVRLILADEHVDAGDRECFHEVVRLPPPHAVREAKRVIDRALAGRRIDAVLAQSESGLGLGAVVARERGLPGLPPEAALRVTSKVLSRETLRAAGVAQPRFAVVSDAAGVRRFADEAGYPVVLKAASSALARLVTLVRGPQDVDAAVARLRAALPHSSDVLRLAELGALAGIDLGHDPTASFLVEAFARGLPVETDGVAAGEDVHVYGVTEQVMPPPPLFYFEGYLLPADLPAADLATAESTSLVALRALGVRDTGWSIEMRLDAGRAAILEVNGRLGWDEGFGDLFETLCGAQPVFQTLQIALGAPVTVDRRAGVHCAVAYACCYEDRLVGRVPAPAEVAAVGREHGARGGLCVASGARMHAPPHPEATPHLAWMLATDPGSSRAAYARARAAVDALRIELLPAAGAGDARMAAAGELPG